MYFMYIVKSANSHDYGDYGDYEDGQDDQDDCDDESGHLEESFELIRENQLSYQNFKYGGAEYIGIVGHSSGNMVCNMCPIFLSGKKCHHIKLIESEENQDQSVVSRFQTLSNSSVRKREPTEYLLRKKIPQDVTPAYKTILQKSPMQSKTDLYFIGTSCSDCGGPSAKSVSTLILFAESMLCRDMNVHDRYCKKCEKVFHYAD